MGIDIGTDTDAGRLLETWREVSYPSGLFRVAVSVLTAPTVSGRAGGRSWLRVGGTRRRRRSV
jgi:hypothetical protein